MPKTQKSEQLQIRISASQKRAIQQQATKAQVSMSTWIRNKLLPSSRLAVQSLIEEISGSRQPSFAFAELLELIVAMSAEEFEDAVSQPPTVPLDPYWRNYLAATFEHAAATKHAKAPSWTRDVAPLEHPVFGSSLTSLRLHLLLRSPPAFAARNIFIDASVGQRV